LETRNGNVRSSGKPSTAKADEGYCNGATQSGPLTHSQSHQAQNTVEHTEVKQKGLDKRGNKRTGTISVIQKIREQHTRKT